MHEIHILGSVGLQERARRDASEVIRREVARGFDDLVVITQERGRLSLAIATILEQPSVTVP